MRQVTGEIILNYNLKEEMRAFVQAAGMAALTAAQSRDWVEGIGANGASGQMVRLSKPDTKSVFGADN